MTFKTREAYRFHVRIPATLLLANGDKLDIVVTDFARLGFKCDTPQLVPIGTRATLVIHDAGSFPATLRWNMGRSAGGQFLEKIQAELISQVLTSSVNLVPFNHNHQPLAELVRC